jgi:hypothetical protein
MEKSSQIAWKFVPPIHFFPLKVVPLIEILLYLQINCPAAYDAAQKSNEGSMYMFDTSATGMVADCLVMLTRLKSFDRPEMNQV